MNLIKSICNRPERWYHRFGLRFIAKLSAFFAREIALEQIMEYVRECKVEGDYAEFGVYEGRNFIAAVLIAKRLKMKMKFFAFDSFSGLPWDEGEFKAGDYSCSQEKFEKNVIKNAGSLDGVQIVPGYFSKTALEGPQKKLAIAWIDCDIYDSTVPALYYIYDNMASGGVVVFDDWFNHKGRPDAGEQKAFNELTDSFKESITMIPFQRIGWAGQSFIFHRKKPRFAYHQNDQIQ